jgi:hypothetical protein
MVANAADLDLDPYQVEAIKGECCTQAQQWVGFLIDDESSARSFFLQEYRLRDQTFYSGDPRRLRPLCRSGWAEPWQEQLPWLIHPEHLTVTELELALAIFRWHEPAPRLCRWLQARPHVLWRIHSMLLRRYCFELLPHLRRAMRADGLYRPPFRAGELPRLGLRIGGLTAVGYVACLGIDAAPVLFFHVAWWLTALLLVACAGVTYWLYLRDVLKRNRGVMENKRHAARRVGRIMWRSLLWSGLLSLPVLVLWWQMLALPAPLQAGVVPQLHPAWPISSADLALTLRAALGWLAMVGFAGLLGCLVQWLWEDTSVLEPI